MRHGNFTREMAVEIVGEGAVEKVERENCDFTNRVQCDGDSDVEFSASVRCADKNDDSVTLVAYYYQDRAAVDAVKSLDQLDWEIHGFEIV